MQINKEQQRQHILSLSYGKDSLACLGAIEQLGWPLDRIVHAEVWATETIPADLPAMVELKAKADKIIKEHWGIEVEHVCDTNTDSTKRTFNQMFYARRGTKTKYSPGGITGWPPMSFNGAWCNKLKQRAINQALSQADALQYIGITADEPSRFHNLTDNKKSPLVEAGWTETYCRKWCEENDLLSPIYTSYARGGCWFCHNQGLGALRALRKNYPEYWAIMLKWDADSPVTFKPDGHTVRDYDRRFAAEDAGLVPTDKTFRWAMLDAPRQISIFDFIKH